MKKIMLHHESSYLLNFGCATGTNRVILIIPNSAGYFASSPNYGEAKYRINEFCSHLSASYEIFYLVLPGQDPTLPDRYSYTGSIESTIQAIKYLKERYYLIGVIGMCTGGAIASVALKETGFLYLPLILYNTAVKVGWHNPIIQIAFSLKYGRDSLKDNKPAGPVLLHYDELTQNAPKMLGPIIREHKGKLLQIITGKSDYKIEVQKPLKEEVPNIIEVIILPTMSDAPISESEEEYGILLHNIVVFFGE